jgi:medium-chain acyl-[acyl-carrier-protein] hydrolase
MERASNKASAWLAEPRPNPGAGLRLFCFPYSGADASIFATWADNLPAAVEVWPVRFPGRGTRLAEPPFTRLGPLVQAIANALLPYLVMPFAFFGHSLGALVSFELARRLRKLHGLGPAQLFVSGHSAPQIPDRETPIHALPEPEFLEKLRQLNGTPEAVLAHSELRQLILPGLRADFAMCEAYVYEEDASLECPIAAFGGLQDDHVSRDQLEAWRAQTTARFTLRMFPGDHFYINTARPLLLRVIAQELYQLMSKVSEL